MHANLHQFLIERGYRFCNQGDPLTRGAVLYQLRIDSEAGRRFVNISAYPPAATSVKWWRYEVGAQISTATDCCNLNFFTYTDETLPKRIEWIEGEIAALHERWSGEWQ